MTPELLDCISLRVPAALLEPFEAALSSACRAVSFFHDEANDAWDIQGVKERGAHEAELESALAVAEMLTGFAPDIERTLVPAGGWLARTQAAFPEQLIGRRVVVRGTHISASPIPGRITLTLDAGLAFGTGEHNSTRGCMVALERVARAHRPARILDLGTGSGILAIAAALFAAVAWASRNIAGARSVYAAGSDAEAARLSGIDTATVNIAVFAAMGALAGLAAILNAIRFADVQSNAGVGLELKAIAAVVVGGASITGGRGTLIGTLIGVALLGSIGPALTFLGISPYWEKAIQGGIILTAVIAEALASRRWKHA